MQKEEIKNYLFSEYDRLIKHAKEYPIKNLGLYAEDLVNEAIVGVIDCDKTFQTTEELKKFVEVAIKNVYFHEKDKAQGHDEEFQERFNRGEVAVKGTYVPAKIDEYYDLFFRLRYPQGQRCSKCGSDKVKVDWGIQYCMLCNTFLSITNNTFLKNAKISYTQIYRLAVSIAKSDRINYKILSFDSGIKNISALFKGRAQFMKDAMLNTERHPCAIITELLQVTDKKVDRINTKKKLQKRGSLASLNRSLNQLDNLEYLIHAESQRS